LVLNGGYLTQNLVEKLRVRIVWRLVEFLGEGLSESGKLLGEDCLSGFCLDVVKDGLGTVFID
jgi:hypothetical protein